MVLLTITELKIACQNHLSLSSHFIIFYTTIITFFKIYCRRFIIFTSMIREESQVLNIKIFFF